MDIKRVAKNYLLKLTKQEISSDAWHLKQRILWWLEQNWLADAWQCCKTVA